MVSPKAEKTPSERPLAASAPDPARLLDSLPVGVLHVVEERVDYANPALLAMAGETAERVLGRPFWDLFAAPGRPVLAERYWARQRGVTTLPSAYEMGLLRADGSTLRVEIEPAVLGERETLILVRDASGRVRDNAFLAALSEVALQVQRARGIRGVLEAAGAGLHALGIGLAVLKLEADTALLLHADGPAGMLQAFERLSPQPLRELRLDLDAMGLRQAAAPPLRNRFEDGLAARLGAALRRQWPSLDPARVEAELGACGLRMGVLCPLIVHGEVWGLLGAGASAFSSTEAEALGLLASKVASAIEIASTIEDLERKNRELAAIQAVATSGSDSELERLLPHLLELASQATASDAIALYLLDGVSDTLRLVGLQGDCEILATRYRTLPVEGQSGSPAWQTRLLPSACLPPQALHDLAAAGLESVAVVPLRIKGRFAGLLAVARRGQRPYDQDALRSIERLCSQIAIQIESARLHADAHRRVRLLSVLFDLSQIATESLEVAPIVARGLEKLTEAIVVDAAAIHLLEDGSLRLAGARGEAPGIFRHVARVEEDPLCGRAARERRAVLLSAETWPDATSNRARRERVAYALSVPLLAKNQLLGTFSILRRFNSPFGEEETRLLESSAAQVAVAIEHARLFEEERRRVEELELLVEIGRLVTASLDLETILEPAAAGMARMAEATDAYICLLEPSGKVLEGVATSAAEHREHFRTVRIEVDKAPVVAECLRSHGPVRVPDAEAFLGPGHWLRERYRQKSLLALPLLVRDEPIGVVVISDSDRQREWTEAQIERATVVARQVAVAVANARLYDDLKKSYDTLAQTQEQLVKRERLAALGELSAIVAHEVRNPLGVIFNSLITLRRMLKPEGDAAMLLDIVEEEADRLNRIVGDLLDFARPTEPAMQAEPLQAVLTRALEAARPAAAANSVETEMRIRGELPPVRADARMLRQVLLNLVINAVQAMPGGGRVTLEASAQERQGRTWACIEVTDNGPGIPPDVAERIYQPFFTTKATGTGLGLAVVKRIVEAHHGEIELESAPGRGATFRVWLPV